MQGIQSDNGSLLYYLPGYNPYGNFMGVDGQQPYFSSSGYFQSPVSYGWDSTYGGDLKSGTRAARGGVKSANGSSIPVKSNGFNSINTSKTVDSKNSTLPSDMKSRQSTPSSNYSKPILQTQPLKPLNKLSPAYQSAGHMNGFQPVGRYPSFTNPNRGFFAHTSQLNYSSPMNYRPNGRVWNGNDRYRVGEKFNRNGNFEPSNELTRGPRVLNRDNPSKPSAEDEQKLGPSIRRDQYNLETFLTEYDNAKFYVIKSYSEDDVHKCIKYDVWSSTPNGNKKLDAAFHDAEAKASESGTKCPIFLFFSVNRSGQFVGVAEMIGPVDFGKNMDFWQLDKWNGFFPIKWHMIKDIPNSQLRHIILENNDNRDVTYTRDTQEVELKQGLEMLNIFKSYSIKTSMLDDFNFYENREKMLKAKRSTKPEFPKQVKAGERPNEDASSAVSTNGSCDPAAAASLINLTRNLSLNPLTG
ncbi:hypothetical protein LguiA_027012 [Lonicera macranthoides]